jgi:RNA polymerase sigma-70 factor, ECF subfamily
MKPERTQTKIGAQAETTSDAEVAALLARAGCGDAQARDELFTRYRARLWRMVAVRLEPRLASRVDASDIVQEALTEAAGRLADSLGHRPLPFYAWLRHIAWQHLVECHQRHIGAQRRSVVREERGEPALPDESAALLVDRLLADNISASRQVIGAEERQRLRAALALLPPRDQAVLVLRHLEQLSTADFGAVLGLTSGAVMTRHTRALERFSGPAGTALAGIADAGEFESFGRY